MHYEVELVQTVARTVEVQADSPEAAVLQAREDNPGFRPKTVVELREGGKDETVLGFCESCGTPLFVFPDSRPFVDVDLCNECANVG